MHIIHARSILIRGLLGCFLLAVGCESTPQTNARMLVKTPRTSYDVDDTVHIEATNLSGSPVYYICNGQIRLQRVEGEQIHAAWDVRGADTCTITRAILLGELVSFAVLPEEMDSVAADDRFVSGGEFRFQIDLYKDPECTLLLDEESDRLTNTVVLTR